MGIRDWYNIERDIFRRRYRRNLVTCHGCKGKGWVENSKGELKKCPVCDGDGRIIFK